MKRILNIKTLALGLILLLGNMPVSATERPFSCTGKGIASILPGGGVPSADVIGTGNATHMGLFTNSGRVTFNPDANDPTLVHPSGQATFTAADGTPPPGRMVATPFPVHENGRSVALTGMFPSKSISASAKVLMLRNRFIVLLLLKLRISAYYVLKW